MKTTKTPEYLVSGLRFKPEHPEYGSVMPTTTLLRPLID